MSLGTTVTGVRFEYSGSLVSGLIVSFQSSVLKITPEVVKIIRHEITTRSPVLMGANVVGSDGYLPNYCLTGRSCFHIVD